MLGWTRLPACLLLFVSATTATIARNWTNPKGDAPSYTSTYLVGERIYLSWQPLNNSLNDLWLVRPNRSDEYTLRIASSLNITNADAFPWMITVPEDEILKDTRFAFVFTEPGSSYDPDADSDLESPSFNLLIVNQATPPNGTAVPFASTQSSPTSSVPSSTILVSTSTTLPPQPAADLSLGTKEIVGIAVGALAAVGFAGFLAGYLIFKRRWAQPKRTYSTKSEISIIAAAEVAGSSQYPVEVGDKDTQVHEMAMSKETLAWESDSTSVYEVGNTVKRPGLHEMAG